MSVLSTSSDPLLDQIGMYNNASEKQTSNNETWEASGERILTRFSEILTAPTQKSSASKVGITVLKGLAMAACFTSQYPSALAAAKISNNLGLNLLFGAGEFVAWGSVYSVCAITIINELFSDKDLGEIDSQKSLCSRVAYWTSLIVIGVFVQTSDVYIAYKYTDKTLFWPIYVGLAYLTFTVTSLNEAYVTTTITNNIFTRCIYKESPKLRTLKARDAFCTLLNKHIGHFLSQAKDEWKDELLNVMHNAHSNYDRSNIFLNLLSGSSYAMKNQFNSMSSKARTGRKWIQVIAPVLYLSNLYLDSRLVNESSKLITDSPYFFVFLFLLSNVPNLFLDFDMSCGTIRNLYSGVYSTALWCRSQRKLMCNRENILRSIGYTFTGLMSVLGLGATITVVNDMIGFKKNFTVSSMVLIFTALLTADSLNELSTQAVDYSLYCCDTEESKQIAHIAERCGIIARQTKKMSDQQFEDFIRTLDKELELEDSLMNALASAQENGQSVIDLLEEANFHKTSFSASDSMIDSEENFI